MKLPIKKTVNVEAKYIRFHAKIRDEGTYILLDDEKEEIAEHDGYVPSFFPYGKDGKESHHGDYIDLWIDIETGTIVNWKKPTVEQVVETFEKASDETT